MAMAIMILSNEGGKDAAVIVAASKEEAREVAGIAKRCAGAKFLGAETEEALRLAGDALADMGHKWEEAHKNETGCGNRQ